MNRNKKNRIPICALMTIFLLLGCGQDSNKEFQQAEQLEEFNSPIIIEHELGSTVMTHRPQRVAALDMNEVDFLDQLGVPIAGMVKDYVPHFLSKYQFDSEIQDLGAIVQPNIERVYSLKPDLILMTPLHTNFYHELTKIAPTLNFDIDYKNSKYQHIDQIKKHLMILGKIFDKEVLAQQKADEIDIKVKELREITIGRPEKALIVLHNNGAFSSLGIQSRYAFIFSDLGVKPASTAVESNLHGEPISSEFIHQVNPDILYIIDRTAVMERHPIMNAEQMANPLLRDTKAWKNGKVIFVDADAWYITAASITSLKIIINDVMKGYQDK